MALSFPLALAEFADTLGIAQVKWLLQDNREFSGMGSGQILQADLGPSLWQGDVTLREWYHDDARRIEAKINAMIRSQGTFYLYDPRHRGPALDPNGTELNKLNLLSWTEQFNNAAWVKTRVSAVADQAVAPDGTTTMDKIVENTDNNSHFIQRNYSFVSGKTYCLSVFASEVAGSAKRYLAMVLPSAAFGAPLRGIFDLDDGTYTTSDSAVSAGMESVGGGIYRCWVVATATETSAASMQLRINITSGGYLSSYAGDGSSGLYLWGAQLEEGSAPTPYMRREGTAGPFAPAIKSVPDNKSMSLKGLPAGYKLRAGDYLAFDYGSNPTRRAFHQLAEDATADGSGDTGTFEVSPFIRTGAAADINVTLIKPAMKCIIMPGSLDVSSTGNVVTTQISFSVVQKL